jgi:hypothetical protein
MKETKLIISNIGNRNITYNGKLYDDLYPSRDAKKHTSFRKFTENFLQKYPEKGYKIKSEYSSNLALNIIHHLIEKYKEDTELIVLCTSNQEEEHPQDTVYAGWIMKELIEEKYKIPVIIREIECSVVDHNQLMKRYKQILKWINRQYGDQFIHVCDAGGTSQQKFSLKLITEFIIESDRHKVEYVFPDNKIEETPPLEYRNIIASMQAEVLINRCEYDAALYLFGSGAQTVFRDTGVGADLKLMALGSWIFKNNYRKAAHIAQSFTGRQKQDYPFLSRYEHLEPAGNFQILTR